MLLLLALFISWPLSHGQGIIPPSEQDRAMRNPWEFYRPTNDPLFPPQFETERIFRTVDTNKGRVIGTLIRLHDGPGREWDRRQLNTQQTTPWQDWMNVTVFLGIPYAEPPIGDLRFRVSILFLFDGFKASVDWLNNLILFDSSIDWLIHRFIHRLIDWFVDWLIHRFDWSVDRLIDWLIE